MLPSIALHRAKRVLRNTPLRTAARWGRFWWRLLGDTKFRRREIDLWREYLAWRQSGGVLCAPLVPNRGKPNKVLIVGKGTANGAKIESFLIKGLELAGYTPVILTERDLVKFYKLGGTREFLFWEDFNDLHDGRGAADVVRNLRAPGDLFEVEHAGTRAGRFAISTALRFLRAGRLDLTDPYARRVLTEHLADGMMRAAAAGRILAAVQPSLALFLGNRYTGHGELMDVCISGGVPVITWFEAHRSNTLMLKRYGRSNVDQHHASLSDDTWRRLCQMHWTADRRAELAREMSDNYTNGDWYCRGGTQFHKQIVAGSALRTRLGLDPNKKTVVVFPHIVWDATLFWGEDLFDGYEDWLVETVRAACANPHVNWVLKIHPANVVKSAWEGYEGETAETAAIRRHVGALPSHIHLIPASSDINTFSLFDVMDCCVTVRGTIGIEAASRGINVLTAGTGRYDAHGFTIDSTSRDEYLHRLAHVHELAPMPAAKRDLAERFAYGAFVVRPWRLSTLTIEYDRDPEATMRVRLRVSRAEDLARAADLRAFADWIGHSQDEDFLEPQSRLVRVWPQTA